MNHLDRNENWTACPAGTFKKVRDDHVVASRQRAIWPYVKGVSLIAVIAVTLFGLSLLGERHPTPSGSPSPVTLSCEEAARLLPEYIAGELDVATSARMDAHIAVCPRCRQLYHQMRQEIISQRGFQSMPDKPDNRGDSLVADDGMHWCSSGSSASF